MADKSKQALDLFPVWNTLFDITKGNDSEISRNEIFGWCRYFYNRTLVGAVYSKMASYPVANLEISHSDPDSAKRYSDVLLKNLKLKEKLVKIGKYYFTLSNAIVIVTRRINKMIKCPACNELFALEKFAPKGGKNKYFISRKKIVLKGGCPKCGSSKHFIMEDRPISGHNGISIVILRPEQIEIVYNEVTGDSEYYYKLSQEMHEKIKGNEHDILCRTPQIFIDAAIDDQKIKLSKRTLFHFKMPDMDEYTEGWAVPEMVRAFYDLYTFLLMEYTNQSLAKKDLIPMDVLYPQSEQGAGGAHVRTAQQYNFAKWYNKIKDSYTEWKKDPTEPIIMPVPVGFQQLKGFGKRLMLMPEIAEIVKNILASLEVPLEFLYGGATWSRQNVAVVILENKLNAYSSQLQDLIDFVVDRVSKDMRVESHPDVKLGKCKLVEDVTLSQLMTQMASQNKLSWHSVFNRLNIDYDKDVKYRKSEANTESDVLIANARAQANAQGVFIKTTGKYQAITQNATIPLLKDVAEAEMEVQLKGQKAMMDMQMEAQNQQMQAQGGSPEEQEAQIQQELENLAGAWVSAKFQEEPETFEKFKQELLQESTDKFATVENYVNENRIRLYGDAYINADSDELRGKILGIISSEEPNLAKLVMEYIEGVQKKNEQAAVWALQIIQGTPEQREAYARQLSGQNVPEEFRQMVMSYVDLFQSRTNSNPAAFSEIADAETGAHNKMMEVAASMRANQMPKNEE